MKIRHGKFYPYEEPKDHFSFLHQMEHRFRARYQQLDHDQIEQHNEEALDRRYATYFIVIYLFNSLKPSFVLTSICAPFSSNNRTIFSLPHFDATWIGVIFCYKIQKLIQLELVLVYLIPPKPRAVFFFFCMM